MSKRKMRVVITGLEVSGVKLKVVHTPCWIGQIGGVIFKTLNKFLGISPPFLYITGTVILDFACDITKAKRELMYRPKIDLKEGIKIKDVGQAA